jgi:hypothetical protein
MIGASYVPFQEQHGRHDRINRLRRHGRVRRPAYVVISLRAESFNVVWVLGPLFQALGWCYDGILWQWAAVGRIVGRRLLLSLATEV